MSNNINQWTEISGLHPSWRMANDEDVLNFLRRLFDEPKSVSENKTRLKTPEQRVDKIGSKRRALKRCRKLEEFMEDYRQQGWTAIYRARMAKRRYHAYEKERRLLANKFEFELVPVPVFWIPEKDTRTS